MAWYWRRCLPVPVLGLDVVDEGLRVLVDLVVAVAVVIVVVLVVCLHELVVS